MTTRYTTPRGGHMASDPNARTSRWPAVMPHSPAMQPPPNDPKKLYRECTRLSWALHCLLSSRSKLVIVVDRYDQKLARMRREYFEYAAALEALDPELFARAEERRKDYDQPIKALKWAQGDADDVS